MLEKNKTNFWCFGLLMLATLLLTGCGKTALYSGLHEKEANEMIAILQSRGISIDKIPGKDGVWSINVDSDRVTEAIEHLNSYGYPKERFESMGMIFKKSGLVSSPSEERIRFMYGLSQAIADTLTQIDGVLTARVHIVLQENDPLSEQRTPSSAAVFIKYRRGSGVDGLTSQIKKLVTNSIEGLTYEKVSLVFVPSDTSEIAQRIEQQEEEDDRSMMRLILIGSLVLVLLLIVAGAVLFIMKSGKKSIKKKKAPNKDGEEAS